MNQPTRKPLFFRKKNLIITVSESGVAAGSDIHRATAAEVFGVAPELVSDDLRRSAKAINFGLETVFGRGTVEHCKSINAAKRKSVELQKANGGLGRGSVQVIR